MPNQRQIITDAQLDDAMRLVMTDLNRRCVKHGLCTFASCHEIDGVLDEEMREWKDAVQIDGSHSQANKVAELSDIAVAAIFGIASIQSGGTDW
jgi:hypothetical protein